MSRFVNRSRSQSTLTPQSAALAFLDFVAVLDCAVVARWVLGDSLIFPPDFNFQAVVGFGAITVSMVFALSGLYKGWRGQSLLAELRNLLFALLVAAAVVSIVFVPTIEEMPQLRYWAGLWLVMALFSLILVRLALRFLLRKLREAGWNVKKIVLVGGGPVADRTIRQLQQNRWAGLDVVGVFAKEDERWPEEKERRLVYRPPTLGGYGDVMAYIESNKDIDQIWFAMPLSAEELIQEVLEDLRLSTIDICFVPDIFGFDLLNHSIAEVAGLPLLNLRVSPIVGPNQVLKTIEDWVVSILALTLAAPLLLIIAVLVKAESKGPVIFRQKRQGWDGTPFTIYKFRTMRIQESDTAGGAQATRNDNRVTTVGYWLRRTSLDEFPQFINVLQGRMSVVGPRPHAVDHGIEFMEQVDKYMLRHKVKPGITGLAQINGFRGETETLEKMQRRIELDLEYIENWSLFGDFRIIFLTVFRGFVHENAY